MSVAGFHTRPREKCVWVCVGVCACVCVCVGGWIIVCEQLWPLSGPFWHRNRHSGARWPFLGNGDNWGEHAIWKVINNTTSRGPKASSTQCRVSPHVPAGESGDLSSAAHRVSTPVLFLHRSVWTPGEFFADLNFVATRCCCEAVTSGDCIDSVWCSDSLPDNPERSPTCLTTRKWWRSTRSRLKLVSFFLFFFLMLHSKALLSNSNIAVDLF